jgi:chromosome segregation ATPase
MRKKKTHLRWRRDEVELLIQNLNKTPNELVKLFPTRGYFSILSKRSKLVKDSEKQPDANQPTLDFENADNISNNENQIEDIREILNQALVKLEEFATKNQESQIVISNLENVVVDLQDIISRKENTIRELEKALLDVSAQYESDKRKFDSLASETKSTWGRIKKVFL